MLQFKNVTTSENTLKTIGTVAEVAGVKGYHELSSEKNFKGTLNPKTNELSRVTIAIYNAQGQRSYVNCSKPLSAELRASKSKEELQAKLTNLASLPILALPRVDLEGNPVMEYNEETGEEQQIIVYTISNKGGSDMSSTRTVITEDMLKAEAVKRSINFEDLIAI